MDWRYRLRLAEIAERERAHLEESSMQYANLRQAKLNLLEMEKILEQAKFAVQFKELRRTTLKVFAKDEKLCQIKLNELAESEMRCQSTIASMYKKLRQADLTALDAEERVHQTKLIALYEKQRQAMQPALAFAEQPPKKENPTVLSQSYEKVRDWIPKPIRSAVPVFSSALGKVDSKMASDINRGLQSLSDNWNQEPISNKQRVSNTLGNIGMPIAYNSARLLLSPAKREEFSESQYDYDNQYKALSPEIKEHFINLDRFKNESLGSYQNWRNKDTEQEEQPNRGKIPVPFKIDIGKTWRF